MKKLFLLFLLSLLTFGAMHGQTFTTIADGAVNDPAIWSTDGGATPCSCTPTTELPTFTLLNVGSMNIYHQVTLSKFTLMMGTGLVVNVFSGASLSGPVNVELRNVLLNNYGVINVADLRVFNSGFLYSVGDLTVSPGHLTNEWQGRMELGGQVFVPNGNLPNEGWITILQNAHLEVGGSVTNDSYVDIEPGACINIYGNFTNELEVNLINGPGSAYIESGGDITNLGTWDTHVDWCAAGFGSGLTHAANCANCSLLPVELTDFEATVTDGEVILRWKTGMEMDNSHFALEKSQDGQYFELFTQTTSNSPFEGEIYQAIDADPFYGISWYRLSQTDQNGVTRRLKTILVNNTSGPKAKFGVFPDPFENRIQIAVSGLEGEPLEIRLTDLAGRKILKMKIAEASEGAVYELKPGDLPLGVYVVMISSRKVTQSFKVLHR
jgi:hypothetical protein